MKRQPVSEVNGLWRGARVFLWAGSLWIFSASCATTPPGNRPLPLTSASVSERGTNTPTIVGPPVTAEADPENVEQRFGFAEAKARREREARKGAASAGQSQIEPVAGNGPSAPAVALPEHTARMADAPAAQTTSVHDHNHGGAPTDSAAGMSMCPCNAAMAHKPADSK